VIELILSKIKIDENRNEQVIVFREKSGDRYLPVVIGMPEVNAIKLRLSGIKPPRPMTHDLILNIIKEFDAHVDRIVIDKLENNTFHAKIHIQNGKGKALQIDARPSDSVAVALRCNAPVFVEDEVLGAASVQEI